MFKRVERKRKKREEDEELNPDEDMRGTMRLDDTDSDESDSGSDSAQSDDSDVETGGGRNQEEDVASKDEDVGEDPPISVAEALKDPIYLVSFDPAVYGCVMCKGKLIKNAEMAAAHKNANAHKRRFEQFRQLSVDAGPRSDAWELVRAILSTSNVEGAETQELSKRTLKRQVKQTAIREKRKRHKELKAKAIAKKALKKLSSVDDATSAAPSKVNFQNSPEPQTEPGNTRKKKKLERDTSTITEVRNVSAKSASYIKTSSKSKKLIPKSRLEKTRKANKPS